MIFTAIILGLVGSLHCVAMCGPVAALATANKGKSKITSALLYGGGKTIAYALFGALFGIIPALTNSFKVQAIISISIGSLMLLFAIFPFFLSIAERKGMNFLAPFFKWKNELIKKLNRNKAEFSFYIGFFNGFIPCGLVYTAALASVVQPTFFDSILYMLFFGIGTLPLLMTISLSSSYIQKVLGKRAVMFQRIALIVVGCIMLYQGQSNMKKQINPEQADSFMICAVD